MSKHKSKGKRNLLCYLFAQQLEKDNYSVRYIPMKKKGERDQ